jgi:hypothetical protein
LLGSGSCSSGTPSPSASGGGGGSRASTGWAENKNAENIDMSAISWRMALLGLVIVYFVKGS